MLARLGHKVLVLRRMAIGPVLLDKLRRGKARRLKLEELQRLRAITNHRVTEITEKAQKRRQNEKIDNTSLA